MGCAASVHATDTQCKNPKHKDYDNTIRAVTEKSKEEADTEPQKQPEKREIEFGPVTLYQEVSKVLLVFPVEDGQSEAFLWACRKGGYMCNVANSGDQALDLLSKRNHQMVVIDMRLPNAKEGEQICRRIRSMSSMSNMVILAVCPAIPRWCEEPSVRPYIDMGFSRRYLENHDRGACLNEIIMLDMGEVQCSLKLSLAQTLFQLLDHSPESVEITDKSGLCSYVNPAFERLTGFRKSEILGSPTDNLLNEDKTATDIPDMIRKHKIDGKCWEGIVYNNKKSGDPVPIEMKILPVFECEPSHCPQYFITSRVEVNQGVCKTCLNKASDKQSRRMSNGRIRTGTGTESSNTSINSNSRRLSKQVDAPIIKILTALRNVQEQSPQIPNSVIENIMAMLRSSELYAPGISLTEDPEAMGFMDGLMEVRGTRSSITGETTMTHRESVVTTNNNVMSSLPHQLKENLATRKEWDYNIFELEKLSQKRPLFYLGFDILVEFGIINILKTEESTLRSWLSDIERNYRSTNSYHNSTHAADVLQASAFFCRNDCMQKCLDPMDFIALLIASICHDIDHPGRTNNFLCNVNDELAILYNDSAVLENHHAAHAFKISVKNKSVNIFQNLDPETFKCLRKSIISMILATDMTQHFDHYNKFVAVIKPTFTETGLPEENTLVFPLSQDHKSLVLRMAIKCADISNPSRKVALSQEWAHRIVVEYRSQIKEEQTRKLPRSLPPFDDIPKSQVMFIQLFASDLLTAFNEFLDFPILTDTLTNTFEYWESWNEQNPYTFIPGEPIL